LPIIEDSICNNMRPQKAKSWEQTLSQNEIDSHDVKVKWASTVRDG